MTDQPPDTIRALIERLERRADIEDVGGYPQTEETDAAYDVPEVTWEEMREIVGLLRAAASTLRALADQGQRASESLCRCGVPRGVPHYCSSLDHAFVGAAAPASGFDSRRRHPKHKACHANTPGVPDDVAGCG